MACSWVKASSELVFVRMFSHWTVTADVLLLCGDFSSVQAAVAITFISEYEVIWLSLDVVANAGLEQGGREATSLELEALYNSAWWRIKSAIMFWVFSRDLRLQNVLNNFRREKDLVGQRFSCWPVKVQGSASASEALTRPACCCGDLTSKTQINICFWGKNKMITMFLILL